MWGLVSKKARPRAGSAAVQRVDVSRGLRAALEDEMDPKTEYERAIDALNKMPDPKPGDDLKRFDELMRSVEEKVDAKDARIAALEAEVARLIVLLRAQTAYLEGAQSNPPVTGRESVDIAALEAGQ